MAIVIVDLPINSMVIFHSFWYVYQRVSNLQATCHASSRISWFVTGVFPSQKLTFLDRPGEPFSPSIPQNFMINNLDHNLDMLVLFLPSGYLT